MAVRLRLEFTTEPFDLDRPPGHALAAREAALAAGFDTCEIGPFGNTAEGPAGTVLPAVSEVLRRALGAGATRVSVQISVVPGGTPQDRAASGGTAPGGAC